MPIPSTVSDLSTTASSNYPSGSESANQLDDYHRALCSIVRQVSDAKEDAGVAATAITAERNAVATLTNKTLVTPVLGTPASGNLANCTFPTLNQNTSGTAAGLSATLAVGRGGTGLTSPGASGNVLTSNGTAWVSSSSGGIVKTTASAAYTPASGELLSRAHGLGYTPSSARLVLECVVADQGYSVGDRTSAGIWNGSATVAAQPYVDGTNCGTRALTGWSHYIVNKTTGAVVNGAANAWKYYFEVIL